jgi:phage terminase small subunit
MTAGKKPLSRRELQFVRAYMKSGNALQAVRKAGYSKSAAARQSYELPRRPAVAAELSRLHEALQEKTEFGVRELFKWSVFGATCDWTSIFRDGTWEIRPLSEWDPRVRRLLEKIDVKVNVVKEGKSKKDRDNVDQSGVRLS